MKALILNSGRGSRLGPLTEQQPKCMTELNAQETILSRQLHQLVLCGIEDVVITTGAHAEVLRRYCQELDLPLHLTFVYNERFAETNYIVSMDLARDAVGDDDVLLMHGDLVFENTVLADLLAQEASSVVVSTTASLPEKDFKAVVRENRVEKIGIEFFEDAVTSQPLYLLRAGDWKIWRDAIHAFCQRGETGCYAEAALNEVAGQIHLVPFDVEKRLCREVDTPENLAEVTQQLREVERRTVYLCFSADVLHSGHMALIRCARMYGRLIIGVMTDRAVASYKRYPLVPYRERWALFENLAGVDRVIAQEELSYRDVLLKWKPDFVVHGDDWQTGVQKPVRDEVVSVLASYGGRLVEVPYAVGKEYEELDRRMRGELSLPDLRRARLRRLLSMKGLVTAIEAHSGLTGLLAEKTIVYENGKAHQFDAMWLSSLCDSTAKGKPDIELVDMTSRFRTIDDILEVTTKPIIFDGDTGGLKEHFVYTVRSLERMGVSMVIIEDKKGLKKNSLFGTEVSQTQDTIEHFAEKIRAGKHAQKTSDFMICARIESLILEKGMEDALTRARAYVKAGADAIMIHSRKKDPAEIFAFVEAFRVEDAQTPIVVVPTSFNQVTEEEFQAHGVNIVIYANQLTRTGFPAMQRAAESILRHHRAMECDGECMPIKDIIRLIPEEL